MSLRVYTGLAASGKTSKMIEFMREHEGDGGEVTLFLSGEHPDLTNRPHVRPGGFMGSRNPDLFFKIDHVLKTDETIDKLKELGRDTMAVFDEAHYFDPKIVDAWKSASDRGVEVLVGVPSQSQLEALEAVGVEPIEIKVQCECGKRAATSVVYRENLTYPVHLCDECNAERFSETMEELLEDVRQADPFPGENKTYQPFFNVDMEGWEFVREDSLARFRIMEDAVERAKSIAPTTDSAANRLSYLDLGCCSGFFCDAMDAIGFASTGVDVTPNFIDWCNRLAKLKGQNITYIKEDAHKFITGSDEMIDVTSTFATIQWVMTQQSYEAGVECFKHLFDRTRHVCVVEMGYTLEDIYKERIPDRPTEIDKHWVVKLMQEHGNFAEIEVYPAGENGIWRDIFVGFKEEPQQRPFRRQLENGELVQASTAQQLWEDGWAGESFEVFFKATSDLTAGTLKGWRPDGERGPKTTVFLNEQEVDTPTVTADGFVSNFDAPIKAGEIFSIRVEAEQFDSGNADDERPLAFILQELSLS